MALILLSPPLRQAKIPDEALEAIAQSAVNRKSQTDILLHARFALDGFYPLMNHSQTAEVAQSTPTNSRPNYKSDIVYVKETRGIEKGQLISLEDRFSLQLLRSDDSGLQNLMNFINFQWLRFLRECGNTEASQQIEDIICRRPMVDETESQILMKYAKLAQALVRNPECELKGLLNGVAGTFRQSYCRDGFCMRIIRIPLMKS
jgi:hypothetical protein